MKRNGTARVPSTDGLMTSRALIALRDASFDAHATHLKTSTFHRSQFTHDITCTQRNKAHIAGVK